MADATMADALVQPCGVHRGRAVFNALNLIAVDDLAIEIQKHHHDSDLLRTLVADLREKRVDLKEFCIRVRMLLGAPVLVATVRGLRAAQSLKRARLQQREHQLASEGVRRRRTRRSGKSWLASVCCSTAPPISEGA